MTTKTYLLIAVAVLLATACIGKQQKNKAAKTQHLDFKETVALTFDSIVVEEKTKLFPNESDSIPYATLSLKFVYPKSFRSEEDLQKLQSVFYKLILGDEYANAHSPSGAVDMFSQNYKSLYRKEADNFKKNKSESELDDEEERWYMLTLFHELTASNRIEFINNSLISMSVIENHYLGGAHDVLYLNNHIIKLNDLTTLKESELFTPGYKEPLAKIIRKKLLKYMKEEAARGGGQNDEEIKEYFFKYDSIYFNGNFLMNDKGLLDVYNVYEVAPYAAGTLEAFIPYGEIGNLLMPELFNELFPNIDLQKETGNTDNTDSLAQIEEMPEEMGLHTDYNQYPIAYIKDDGKLYFFNPEDKSTVQFKEETDTVFNCVYSDMDAMFYYTLYKNDVLAIKKVDFSVSPIQMSHVADLKKPKNELYNQTDYSRAQLRFINNHLLLEHDFNWDYYSYSKFVELSLADNSTSIINWNNYERKYESHPYPLHETTKDYSSIYKKAEQLDLSKYKSDPNNTEEPSYFFSGASYDGQKILFSILVEFGDLGHGLYCVSNADNTMLKVIDKDISDPQEPLWSNHNVVFLNTRKTVADEDDYNYITELFYTLADTNESEVIDEEVNYFSVRKKHPVN